MILAGVLEACIWQFKTFCIREHPFQHSFTTAESKCEAYNDLFRGTEKEDFFKDFLSFNPEVGGHFETKARMAEDEVIDGEDNEEKKNEASKVRSTMHELGRKNLSSGYYNHEVYCEMAERCTIDSVIFGPKIDPADTKRKISYKESIEAYMKAVDELRKNELYEHTSDDCSEACRKRGCGQVASVDGNWKLNYRICFWSPQNKYPDQDILEEYPKVCSEEPAPGSGFCSVHSKIVESLEYPSELRKFIIKCGADPDAYTKEGKKKVKAVLKSLSRDVQGESTMSAEDAQGTGYLLRNRLIANQDNFKMTDGPDDSCRKDIGIVHRLHSWSRGVEEIVGGGGIIEYWAPIYNSENPVQIFFILLKYLQLKHKGKGEEEYKRFFLSYDNMCHVDSLRCLFSNLFHCWREMRKVSIKFMQHLPISGGGKQLQTFWIVAFHAQILSGRSARIHFS